MPESLYLFICLFVWGVNIYSYESPLKYYVNLYLPHSFPTSTINESLLSEAFCQSLVKFIIIITSNEVIHDISMHDISIHDISIHVYITQYLNQVSHNSFFKFIIYMVERDKTLSPNFKKHTIFHY